MPATPRASRPSIARTIHQRASSQTTTTPVKSSPLARSSTPPKVTATARPASRAAMPGSRNSIIISDSPGKALPLTDTAPDLNDYVRSSHPFTVELRNKISYIPPICTTRLRKPLRKWMGHLKEGQLNYYKKVSMNAEDLTSVHFAPVLIYF